MTLATDTQTRAARIKAVVEVIGATALTAFELYVMAETYWRWQHGETLREALAGQIAEWRERIADRAAMYDAIDETRTDVRTLPETRAPFLQ